MRNVCGTDCNDEHDEDEEDDDDDEHDEDNIYISHISNN